MAVFFVADGKMYRLVHGKAEEIKSAVLEGYIEKVRRSAKRNEWKTSGSGAMFTGAFDPNADAQSRLANLSAWVGGVAKNGLIFYYTQTIDDTSGIYSKREDSDDGIVLSDGSTVYSDLDCYRGRLAVAASFGGESHIGLITPGSPVMEELTEGETRDRMPVFSRFEPNVIYYSSAGLAMRSADPTEQEPARAASPIGRMPTAAFRAVGPASLCRLDMDKADIEELFADPAWDFIRPDSDTAGNLYFIRRPYRGGEKRASVGGCLLDILLFPVRIIGALIGFLNIFSMSYSGKGIRKSGGAAAKTADERKLYIDGNLIEADKELKKNSKKDQNPGIIPHSYELCRYGVDHKITVLKRGVLAYRVLPEGILCSNGSALLLLDPATGKEKKLCNMPHITSVFAEEGEILDV